MVGSHVALDLLQDASNEIYATKREKSDLTPLQQLFEWHESTELLSRINWVNADLLNDQFTASLPAEIDEIIHTAAVVSFNPEDQGLMTQVNEKATASLIAYAQKAGVKKFGFISSIAALGRINATGKYNENAEWQENNSNSFYSKTKYASEQIVIGANSAELATYLINPGVILGPCDWNKSSGTIFRTGAKGIAFYSKGQNGFVDVRDVAQGMLYVMKNGQPAERHVMVGQSVPYKDVFSQICLGFGKKAPWIYTPQWLMGIGWRLDKIVSSIKGVPPTLTKETASNANGIYEYDNAKMKALGFQFTPIQETIKDSVPFFQKYYC